LKMLAPVPGDKILDVGAGRGKVAKRVFASSSGLEVYTLEPAEKRVAIMKRDSPQLNSRVGGAEKMPFEGSFFDKAYTTMAAHHFRNLDSALQEFARVLKEGGRFLILDVEPNVGSGRMLRFFENTVMRKHLEFLGLEQMKARLVATGRFEIADSNREAFGYLLLCVKNVPKS